MRLVAGDHAAAGAEVLALVVVTGCVMIGSGAPFGGWHVVRIRPIGGRTATISGSILGVRRRADAVACLLLA
ncbi:MAG TPA: hypothetical protein PKD87_13825 [Burkholderiaceae bacterium]|nr:hypothetical protein [Burkholderiaceae bacterium]